MADSSRLSRSTRTVNAILTGFFTLLSIAWVLPIVIVLINSFKDSSAIALTPFELPTAETFVRFQNYITGVNNGNYSFFLSAFYSLVITVFSVALILLCTSMAAWYIDRVDSLFCKVVYYLCIFSMVVPFQMVMFTLSKTADALKLNTPWTIPIIYLGFGAGLAVFLFTGFVKSIPREVEQAANIDGCNALQTFFLSGYAHHEIHLYLGGYFADHVGVERLSVAVSGVGPYTVYDHSDPYSVFAGQFRSGGLRCHHGDDHDVPFADRTDLCGLSKAYHKRGAVRRRQRIR